MAVLIVSYVCMDRVRRIKAKFVKLFICDKQAYTVLKQVLPY